MKSFLVLRKYLLVYLICFITFLSFSCKSIFANNSVVNFNMSAESRVVIKVVTSVDEILRELKLIIHQENDRSARIDNAVVTFGSQTYKADSNGEVDFNNKSFQIGSTYTFNISADGYYDKEVEITIVYDESEVGEAQVEYIPLTLDSSVQSGSVGDSSSSSSNDGTTSSGVSGGNSYVLGGSVDKNYNLYQQTPIVTTTADSDGSLPSTTTLIDNYTQGNGIIPTSYASGGASSSSSASSSGGTTSSSSSSGTTHSHGTTTSEESCCCCCSLYEGDEECDCGCESYTTISASSVETEQEQNEETETAEDESNYNTTYDENDSINVSGGGFLSKIFKPLNLLWLLILLIIYLIYRKIKKELDERKELNERKKSGK